MIGDAELDVLRKGEYINTVGNSFETYENEAINLLLNVFNK